MCMHVHLCIGQRSLAGLGWLEAVLHSETQRVALIEEFVGCARREGAGCAR